MTMYKEMIERHFGANLKVLSITKKPDYMNPADNHRVKPRWDVMVGVDGTDKTVWLEYDPTQDKPWGRVCHEDVNGRPVTYVRREYNGSLFRTVFEELLSNN